MAVARLFPSRNGTGVLDAGADKYTQSPRIEQLGGTGFPGASTLFHHIAIDRRSTCGPADRGEPALYIDVFDRLGCYFRGICHLGCRLESLVVHCPVRFLLAAIRTILGTPRDDGADPFG